jgi:hypothetical protein
MIRILKFKNPPIGFFGPVISVISVICGKVLDFDFLPDFLCALCVLCGSRFECF